MGPGITTAEDLTIAALRARIEELEEEKAAIGAIVIEAAEDGCLRSRQVHCAEREGRYLDWCVPCKAKFLLLR